MEKRKYNHKRQEHKITNHSHVELEHHHHHEHHEHGGCG